jgi:UDP-N-acetylglucosamine 2-epimerase
MIGINGKKMTKESEKNSLLLIDSSVDFSAVRSFIKKNPSTKIISFDFKSHIILKNENIPHKISDIFLNSDERHELQKSIFKFSKWYEESSIREIIEYNKMNIGKLCYMEFFIFLIPFLKYFFELSKISKQYPCSKFYASSFIFNIFSNSILTTNVYLFETKYNNFNFLYDSTNFQTNFLNIKLSKNFYKKFKNFSENILYQFSRINKKLFTNSIFLVEFNTILYQNLLFGLHDNKVDSVYFGVRRPAIWSSKSYSIINKSRTHIATETEILTSELKKIIENNTDEMKLKFKELFQNDDFFNSFFNYSNISFWSSLKPFFEKLYYSRIDDLIKTIHISKEYVKNSNPKFILILSESGTTEQIMISLAKTYKIPIILLQHGVQSYDSKKSDIINDFTGSMPVLSDKFFVWGEAMKKYALNFGISSEKIFTVGSCAHDNLFTNSLNPSSEDYILFSPESPSNNYIDEYTVKIHQEYEDILKKVCTLSTKLNKKLIIKLHPHIPELDEAKIAKSINADIQIIKQGDISSLIPSCSLFITSGITSAMIDAAYLKKPIIRIKTREWWGDIDTLRSNSSIPISINDLDITINQIFSDPIFYENIIKNGTNFVNDCLSNQGIASKNISNLLMDNS